MKTTTKWLSITAGSVLLLAGIGSVAHTQDKGKETQTQTDKQTEKNTVKTKAKAITPMPDFNDALGLDFNSLETLGSRIAAARKEADPVGLAAVAKELDVAEKVSGKKASLTADNLAEEAVLLARVRYDAKELEAVALLTGKNDLIELSKKAAKASASEEAALKRGETTRGIRNWLYVQNKTGRTIQFRVNGGKIYTVSPHVKQFKVYVNDHAQDETLLEAKYKTAKGIRWVHHVHPGDKLLLGSYWWVLYP